MIEPKNIQLARLVWNLEKNVGQFSGYLCEGGLKGQDISLELKPAQQLLTNLGCMYIPEGPSSFTKPVPDAILSQRKDGQPLSNINILNNVEVAINSFNEKKVSPCYIATGRIFELLESAEIYVNSAIFPQGLYTDIIKGNFPNNPSIASQDQRSFEYQGVTYFYQNLATQVCHAQKIDLLVEHKEENSFAVAAPRRDTISKNDPAILLISTPALNYALNNQQKEGVYLNQYDPNVQHPAYSLASNNKDQDYIEGMFRNIFHAAVSKGCRYITMPAAGLGVFEGNQNLYFNALAKVAKQFPSLNIIYHPARYATDFQAMMTRENPTNIVQATKDILYLADALTKNGYPCAVHNPSDADVVYGVKDVGQYWKAGKSAFYVGEEHIGAITTAPLNSRLLNPKVYFNPIEVNLTAHRIYGAQSNQAPFSGSSFPQNQPHFNQTNPNQFWQQPISPNSQIPHHANFQGINSSLTSSSSFPAQNQHLLASVNNPDKEASIRLLMSQTEKLSNLIPHISIAGDNIQVVLNTSDPAQQKIIDTMKRSIPGVKRSGATLTIPSHQVELFENYLRMLRPFEKRGITTRLAEEIIKHQSTDIKEMPVIKLSKIYELDVFYTDKCSKHMPEKICGHKAIVGYFIKLGLDENCLSEFYRVNNLLSTQAAGEIKSHFASHRSTLILNTFKKQDLGAENVIPDFLSALFKAQIDHHTKLKIIEAAYSHTEEKSSLLSKLGQVKQLKAGFRSVLTDAFEAAKQSGDTAATASFAQTANTSKLMAKNCLIGHDAEDIVGKYTKPTLALKK